MLTLEEAKKGNRSWWRCWLDTEYTWVQIPVPSLSHYGLTHTEVSVNHLTHTYLFLLDSELFESKNIFSFILVSFMLTTCLWWGNKCFPKSKLIHSGEVNKRKPLDPMSLTLQVRAGDWDSDLTYLHWVSFLPFCGTIVSPERADRGTLHIESVLFPSSSQTITWGVFSWEHLSWRGPSLSGFTESYVLIAQQHQRDGSKIQTWTCPLSAKCSPESLCCLHIKCRFLKKKKKSADS